MSNFSKLLEDVLSENFEVGEIYKTETSSGTGFFLVQSIQKNGKAAGLQNETDYKPSKAVKKSNNWHSMWSKISVDELPPKAKKAFGL